jgi:16S rRNA (uracil1498-N3)-methyltransferase
VRALFYVGAVPEPDASVVVDGDEGFHASAVRRLRPGEEVDLGDGAGAVAHCVVTDVVKGRVTARVLSRHVVAPPQPTVTVVQALPKSDRAELAVETATEAGADGFLVWQAARCVARWDGSAKVDKGLARWRAVARAAARQSRRARVPGVDRVVTTADLVEIVGAAAPGSTLVLHESATEGLRALDLAGVSALTLIVGPEGGVADDELARLCAAGARAVRLGPTVLRTSTAAAVALGAVGVLTSRWS